MWVHAYVYARIYGGQRLTDVFLDCLPRYFLRASISNSIVRCLSLPHPQPTGCLIGRSGNSRDPSISTFPALGEQTHANPSGFLPVCQGWNSYSHVCRASDLPTKLFPLFCLLIFLHPYIAMWEAVSLSPSYKLGLGDEILRLRFCHWIHSWVEEVLIKNASKWQLCLTARCIPPES